HRHRCCEAPRKPGRGAHEPRLDRGGDIHVGADDRADDEAGHVERVQLGRRPRPLAVTAGPHRAAIARGLNTALRVITPTRKAWFEVKDCPAAASSLAREFETIQRPPSIEARPAPLLDSIPRAFPTGGHD